MPADKKGADTKGADEKGARPGSPDDIMTPSDMRSILAQSKRGALVSCAIVLTKNKEGVILLDKKRKPKKLAAGLKKAAAEANLTLDQQTMRFGRAVVDVDDDPGLVTLVVNKEAPTVMRARLLEHIKKAGYKAVDITVDAALENEADDDQPAAASAPTADAETDGAADATAPVTNETTSASQPASPPPPPQQQQQEQPTATPRAAEPAQPDARALTKALTELVRRLVALGQDNPQAATALKPLATQAQAGLKSGDLTGAAKAIQMLRGQLAASAAQPASPPQAPTPAPAIAKARLAWVATRQKVDTELGQLHTAFANAFKGHGRQGDLTKAFRTRVDTVLGTLDEALAHKLDAVNNAADSGERAKLVQEAHTLISTYSKHLESDPTIEALDRNPFVPLAVRKTMTATLAALSKAIR